jgi:hypothetical protein
MRWDRTAAEDEAVVGEFAESFVARFVAEVVSAREEHRNE